MDGQLIKATHLLTLPTNFLSVTSISLFTSNNFKGKSIPLNISKRNLNTLNLIKNGHCLQQKKFKIKF